MINGKQALLLDLNNTFMFGEDRFDQNQDYSAYYRKLGGHLSNNEVNKLINLTFNYLNDRYPKTEYRHNFPTVAEAILKVSDGALSKCETDHIIETFAHHELGYIPEEYVKVLQQLKEKYTLALVVDIWSPKEKWVKLFKALQLWELFSASSFSSDHGMVKPSPRPFESVVKKLNIPKSKCIVIGDSARRDLGGALAAGIDCILVGAQSEKTVANFENLLHFFNTLQNYS